MRTLESQMGIGNTKSTFASTHMGGTSPSSYASDTRGTYGLPNQLNNKGGNQNAKTYKDIEEEDFIYSVPCAERQTISLRDSVRVKKDSPKNKGKNKKAA